MTMIRPTETQVRKMGVTMIRPTETQVRKMGPFRWVVSKTLLLRAHTKFKMFF